MVKKIYESFEDADFKKLVKAKGKRRWREFILTLIPKKQKKASKTKKKRFPQTPSKRKKSRGKKQ